MIDFATVYPALRAWFTAGTGVATCIVANQPAPYATDVYGVLEVIAERGVGMDEVTNADVDGVQRAVVRGAREFTLKVELYCDSQRDGEFSVNPLARLRTRASLDRLITILRAVNVALSEFGEASMADEEIDDRWWSVWTANLMFNAGVEYVDGGEDAEAVDVIEAVNGEARVPPMAPAQIFGVP